MPKQEVTLSEYEADPGGTPQSPPEGEGTPEIPPQEPPQTQPEEEVIPEVDERGVPAKNVFAEIRRKQDALTEDNRRLREELTLLRSTRTEQPIAAQPAAVAQQSVVKQSETEVLQQIAGELDQLTAEGKITSAGQVVTYYDRRKRELMPQPDISHLVQQQVQALTTRGGSEQKAISEFPDLQNYQSPLSQAVLREVQARERMNPQFREQNPYYLEEITPRLAMQMGIRPKTFNGNASAVRERMSPPSADAGLRSGVKREEIATPTEADKFLSRYFKTDPAEIAKTRKQGDPKLFVFPEV